jgi:hypothetical protein
LSEYPVVRWALNSVVVATVATALSVLFGALAGYALARLPPGAADRGHRDRVHAQLEQLPVAAARDLQSSMKTLPVGIAVFAPGVGSKTQLEGFGIAMGAVPILSIPSLALFLFPEILRPGHFERSLKS